MVAPTPKTVTAMTVASRVREAHLKLERIALRPADGLCYHVRDEEVPEEATDPAAGHTHAEEI
jgi:hypothetical protein